MTAHRGAQSPSSAYVGPQTRVDAYKVGVRQLLYARLPILYARLPILWLGLSARHPPMCNRGATLAAPPGSNTSPRTSYRPMLLIYYTTYYGPFLPPNLTNPQTIMATEKRNELIVLGIMCSFAYGVVAHGQQRYVF